MAASDNALCEEIIAFYIIYFAIFCQNVNKSQAFLVLNMFINRDMNKLTSLYVTNDVNTGVLKTEVM